jgi:hypothetical protein
METIASVSKALQEYERTGGFASAAATDAEDMPSRLPQLPRLAWSRQKMRPHHRTSMKIGGGASASRLVGATETPAPVVKPVSAEAVVGVVGTSPPSPAAVEVEGVEARVLDEPTAVEQVSGIPETTARATTLEIQVAEETGASLSQGAACGEARTLELACTSWVATSGLDADSEDDEEAAARHTLERGMTLARRAFDELIRPATSVSLLVKDSFLILQCSRATLVISVLLAVDPRVFRSETCPRGAPTPRRADPAGDALVVARVAVAGAVASETSARKTEPSPS